MRAEQKISGRYMVTLLAVMEVLATDLPPLKHQAADPAVATTIVPQSNKLKLAKVFPTVGAGSMTGYLGSSCLMLAFVAVD